MSYDTIELRVDPPLATIRLNRPERMNAVVEEMYREIGHALARCAGDPEVRCLILTGSVLRRDGKEKQAFCAGADLKRHASGERTADQRRRYIRLAHETTLAVWRFPKPIVAAVNGPARGAGAELALNCDFLVMAEEATLGLPEIGLGTFVGGGLTYILPRLIGLGRAKAMIYTGEVIDGPTAVELGLALHCWPTAAFGDETRALALRLADAAPLSLAHAKRQLQQAAEAGIEQALERETETIVECMKSEDWQEGLDAFREKRKPRFRGH